jgi:hypothetical protein
VAVSLPPETVSAQFPQLTRPPHPSEAVPQACPAAQARIAVSGVHPHTPGWLGVPPPHVSGAVQVPQEIVPPQPFGTVPQSFPTQAVAIKKGVHPHILAVPPPPHVCGAVHEPQLMAPPQPLDTVSQFLPAQALIEKGVHPHTLAEPGLPPPQVWPLGQLPPIVPQVTIAVPQPLSTVPQFLPAGHAVIGVHVLAQIPFAQAIPLGQPPAI